MDSRLYRDFARLEDTHWWFTGRRAVIREVLRQRLPPGPLRILDIGCGTGGMLRLLNEFGPVQGIDSSSEALQLARERVGDGARLSLGALPDGLPTGQPFDVITAFDVLEHVSDAVAALRAIRQALAPAGALVVTVPAFRFLWGSHDELNHHYRRYTEGLLTQQLEAAGLSVEWSSYFNSLLFPAVAAVRLAQKLLPHLEGDGDLGEPSPVVNRVLAAVFSSERFLVSRARLPFGVSLIALARPS